MSRYDTYENPDECDALYILTIIIRNKCAFKYFQPIFDLDGHNLKYESQRTILQLALYEGYNFEKIYPLFWPYILKHCPDSKEKLIESLMYTSKRAFNDEAYNTFKTELERSQHSINSLAPSMDMTPATSQKPSQRKGGVNNNT